VPLATEAPLDPELEPELPLEPDEADEPEPELAEPLDLDLPPEELEAEPP
jgi:hypothetical protein